ncbi:DNA-3-methyladenine glycosylase 2 family protein [Halomonas urmiana]|uniref:DNA-3-methyladenine glycosylase 2 family protein n=1 Tax=Halomonas urmiana TaxID=490901 RepID=A0A5R8MLJ6_9GAMM|nr:AlkA N-terminal domain-containing protein [Halomonas urmiana]TLF53055.1 DNA-3-methyladenine glycosylase 2 family protein [Halomonas urmiana]
MLDPAQRRQARLARDARFDGRFFVGVTTTGIYCRPVCPATPPRERNVRYFDSALAAAEAGFRPCLRCRPDSAPDSPAWRGTHTTLERALRLIDEGALQEATLTALCDRLGIGERYLRRLFQQRIGVSPKAYAQHRQCLFAKQLLHQTTLPVTDIAYASGFRSLRRFNDAFHSRIGLTPRDLRRRAGDPAEGLTLHLAYRPPYAWETLRDFHASRAIEGLEWVGERHYGRCIRWGEATGRFTAKHLPDRHAFRVRLELDDLHALAPVVRRIRRVLDLDADTATIEAHLAEAFPDLPLIEGLRLPGVWSPFEAGVRAILGQQVSVVAARRLVTRLVRELGEPDGDGQRFPTPAALADDDLAWLPMPGAPDVWLDGDAGVRRALPRLDGADPARAAPWRSYLTLQLWSRDLSHPPRSQADDR